MGLDWPMERRNMVKSMRIAFLPRTMNPGDLPANLTHLEFDRGRLVPGVYIKFGIDFDRGLYH